jgi:hypothetical protein
LCFLLPHCTSITEREYRTIKSRDHTQAASTDGSMDACHLASVNARPRVSRRPAQIPAAVSGDTRSHASHAPSTELPVENRLNPAYASW